MSKRKSGAITMRTIPYSENGDPLTWSWGTRDGVRYPYLRCKCGVRVALDDWEITPDGQVTPSVNHPLDPAYGGCGFHDHIKLDGYQG